MPEGDTVFLAAQRLHAALSGEPLTRTDFRVPRLATLQLAGRRIDRIHSRGKHLLFDLSGEVTLHTHFMMDGAWHLYRPGDRWRAPGFEARVILETPQWQAVGFRLATVEILDPKAVLRLRASLGPDPLSEDWDPQEAQRRLAAAGHRPIGEVLLDQSVIAGLGNVYRCEICFLRGLHPERPTREVPDLPGLVTLIRRLLLANRAHAKHVTTGDMRPREHHYVYGRAGLPCRRCGQPIRRRNAVPGPDGDRLLFWCPHCQPQA